MQEKLKTTFPVQEVSEPTYQELWAQVTGDIIFDAASILVNSQDGVYKETMLHVYHNTAASLADHLDAFLCFFQEAYDNDPDEHLPYQRYLHPESIYRSVAGKLENTLGFSEDSEQYISLSRPELKAMEEAIYIQHQRAKSGFSPIMYPIDEQRFISDAAQLLAFREGFSKREMPMRNSFYANYFASVMPEVDEE